MALQKERGVNPLAGCLPILPQIPVFLALFHVLRRLAPGAEGLYGWSDELTDEAARAKLFGAPISASFNMTGAKETAILEIADYTTIRIVAFVLIVIMCFTTFFTQKQIMSRSGPVEGQAATVQKFMLYGMPLSLFVSGFFFPIGVLLYWFTNNLWTLGQQFFILRKMPPPGSDAAQGQGRRRQAGGGPEDAGPQARCQAGAQQAGPPRDPAAPLRRRRRRRRVRRRRRRRGRRPAGNGPAAAADGQPARARRRPGRPARARRTGASASAADLHRARRHRPAHDHRGSPATRPHLGGTSVSAPQHPSSDTAVRPPTWSTPEPADDLPDADAASDDAVVEPAVDVTGASAVADESDEDEDEDEDETTTRTGTRWSARATWRGTTSSGSSTSSTWTATSTSTSRATGPRSPSSAATSAR